jgi:serine/threonine-protein kinase
MPDSIEPLLQSLVDTGIVAHDQLAALLNSVPESARPHDAVSLAELLSTHGLLTIYQAEAVGTGATHRLVVGSYVIFDKIGTGGMGTVYRARHRHMNRLAALKILHSQFAESPEYVRRFQREVETVARLSHPNIVAAYDAGLSEAGRFLAMEYVAGDDLDRIVRRDGPLSVRDALAVVMQAADALGYAHQQGIVHRDVKPRNLLRDASGVVKLADLGLVRWDASFAPAAAGLVPLTQAGDIAGSVDFMAPEQAMNSQRADQRSDIYGLGITLYYLLTGRLAYDGATILEKIIAHREQPTPSLRASRSDAPESLDAVWRRMAAKQSTDRYQSVADLLTDLRNCTAETERGPVAVAPRQALPRTASTSAPPRPAPRRPVEAMSVLIVEPSRAQSMLVRGYLNNLDVRKIEWTKEGAEAVRIMTTAAPDVVISAMHLPDMTGADLVQRMRTVDALRDVAFVLISSETDADVLEPVRQAGRVSLLPKPFDFKQMMHAIASLVDFFLPALPLAAPREWERFRVLIVDDSAAARRHVHNVLGALGISDMIEAANGKHAIELLESNTIDLVVSDYHMPEVDGRDLVRYIRSHPRYRFVPVLMITSDQDQDRLSALEQAGVSALCDKPFDPETVRDFLERVAAQFDAAQQPAARLGETLEVFLSEGREYLSDLDSRLIALGKRVATREDSSGIFRTLHALKGSSGFLGFDKLAAVSDVGERVLKQMRDGKLAMTPDTVAVLAALVDAIREILRSIEATGRDGDQDYSGLIRRLSHLCGA